MTPRRAVALPRRGTTVVLAPLRRPIYWEVLRTPITVYAHSESRQTSPAAG